MPFIKGIDDVGKTHWLQSSGYWGERVTAKNFTPFEANTRFAEIQRRNAYLRSSDIVVPLIVEHE